MFPNTGKTPKTSGKKRACNLRKKKPKKRKYQVGAGSAKGEKAN